MQVVGVDFGTTNVRVATWDSNQPDVPPQPHLIGDGDSYNMPAVVAFQRQPGGVVMPVVGQDADALRDGPDTVVVRNIKRWALSDDPFVSWHLTGGRVERPHWWNHETRSVDALGQQYPVREIMRLILVEAIHRAGISGDFEWRAGCPVHASLGYRSELAGVLSEFGGSNKVAHVVEEPILLLALVHRLRTITPGSYLVYDLGGGSFDCAIAEVGEDGQMTVYASHGHPLLGGAMIDDLLAKTLGYEEGDQKSLRTAKELLGPSSPEQNVDVGINLSWRELEETLDLAKFPGRTLAAMREAYISAKVLWKRAEGESPIGVIPSLRLGDAPRAFRDDLDAIILFGGSTKSAYFRERLEADFGVGKVKMAEDLVPPEIPDANLTSLSAGACYLVEESYSPLYVNRLPARVTLEDTATGDRVGYEPYQHFAPNFNPAESFYSDRLPDRAGENAGYELTVTDADGDNPKSKLVDFARAGALNAATRSPRLVIDKFGRIGIEDNGPPWIEVESPSWQTQRQREFLQTIMDRQQEFARSERQRIHNLVTKNPFGWQQ